MRLPNGQKKSDTRTIHTLVNTIFFVFHIRRASCQRRSWLVGSGTIREAQRRWLSEAWKLAIPVTAFFLEGKLVAATANVANTVVLSENQASVVNKLQEETNTSSNVCGALEVNGGANMRCLSMFVILRKVESIAHT